MMYVLAIPGGRMSATASSTMSTSTILDTPFLRDGTLPPLRRCHRAKVPLSAQREAAALVCEGYDPPAKGRPYAKAHPLWDEAPNHTHALMALLVSVCRGRVGEVTLTRCKSLGKRIGRCARTVVRQLAILADAGLITTGHTRGGVRWVALTRAAVMQSKWRPPERLRLFEAAQACRTPGAVAKLGRAEAYLRDALLAEATMTRGAPPALAAGTWASRF